MTVSIIIAVKTWQGNLARCVKECQNLEFDGFEIIVLPDSPFSKEIETQLRGKAPVRIIATGPVGPGQKRDLAMTQAKGDILAFLDDDAYPVPQWLTAAVTHFSDPGVAGVGGPAVTPPEDTFRQKASGAIYENFLVSGGFVYRYLPRPARDVDDYPSCNLLVRTSDMKAIGGFDTGYWPGEDTKLCLDLTKKLKKRIVYDPGVKVFHHRRKVFSAHLKQIASYALHRGYFVKRFPETSLKPAYFVPSLFVLYLTATAVACAARVPFANWLLMPAYLYLILVALSVLRTVTLAPLVIPGIILTHCTYGIYFLKGLCLPTLKEDT